MPATFGQVTNEPAGTTVQHGIPFKVFYYGYYVESYLAVPYLKICMFIYTYGKKRDVYYNSIFYSIIYFNLLFLYIYSFIYLIDIFLLILSYFINIKLYTYFEYKNILKNNVYVMYAEGI